MAVPQSLKCLLKAVWLGASGCDPNVLRRYLRQDDALCWHRLHRLNRINPKKSVYASKVPLWRTLVW